MFNHIGTPEMGGLFVVAIALAAATSSSPAVASPLDNAAVQIEANGEISMSKAAMEYMAASTRAFEYAVYTTRQQKNGEPAICGPMPSDIQWNDIFDADSQTDDWVGSYEGIVRRAINTERSRLRVNLRMLLNEQNSIACDSLKADLAVLGVRDDWIGKDQKLNEDVKDLDTEALEDDEIYDIKMIAALTGNDCNYESDIYSNILKHDRMAASERFWSIMEKYSDDAAASEALKTIENEGYDYGIKNLDEHCADIDEYAKKFAAEPSQ